MRDISPELTALITPIRTINARLTLRDLRLIFDNMFLTDSIYDTALFHDCDEYNGGLLRVANANELLYISYVPDIEEVWPGWTNTGIALDKWSKPGVFENRVFFFSGGNLRYADYDEGLGAPVTIAAGTAESYALAPVSTTEFYYMYRNNYFGGMGHGTTAGVLTPWEGTLYGVKSMTMFDALRMPDKDYIFLPDYTEKRLLQTTKKGAWWSDLEYSLPMELVDETSYFILGGASIINERMYLAGNLLRDVGAGMHVYMKGPYWSLGREMYVGKGLTSTRNETLEGESYSYVLPPGKLLLIGDKYLYCMLNGAYINEEPAEDIVTKDFSKLTIDSQSGQSFRLGATLGPGVSVQPGGCIEAEIGYGDKLALIGLFDVDAYVPQYTSEGQGYELVARSYATKRIAQWQPDASFDYWSQSKMATKASDRGKVIRSAGKWAGEDELYNLVLNEPHFVYSVEKPARNMLVRGKFRREQTGLYSSVYGVALLYYKETKAEAAARLEKELKDITEKDYGHNAIICRYGIREVDGTDPGIGVYLMRNTVNTKLAQSSTFLINPEVDHWIQAFFHDGKLIVQTRTDDTWVTRVELVYDEETVPWFREEQVGRGALYVHTPTQSSLCYTFSQSDMIIPVEDNSTFPISDIAIVDNEFIAFEGKSCNERQDDLITTAEATAYDSYLEMGSTDFSFADLRSRNYVRQSIVAPENGTISGIKVFVRMVGTPEDTVAFRLYTDPITDEKPLGKRLADGTVARADLTTEYAWHQINFNVPVDVSKGSKYYLILTRSFEPHHPDDEHYFQVQINSAGTYASGGFAQFSDDTDEWTEVSGADMPFELLGYGAFGESALVLAPVDVPEDFNVYNDMGLTVTSGAGEGLLFTVLAYQSLGGDVAMFKVDKNPRGMVSDTSVFTLAPTLKVSQRGANNSNATQHSRGTRVSVYRDLHVYIDDFEYYTSEIDLRLEDMLAEVAGKAGIDLQPGKEINMAIVFPGETLNLTTGEAYAVERENAIVLLKGGTAHGLMIRGGAVVVVDQTHVCHYDSLLSLIERVPLEETPAGWTRMSVQDDIVSVWHNDRLIAVFRIDPDLETAEIYPVGLGTVSVDYSETDVRVDNFIMDMGVSGARFLTDLINERRVFVQDSQYGKLKVFRNRESVPGSYGLAVGYSRLQGDPQATRIRMVGMELAEKHDETLMKTYGNVFEQRYIERLDSRFDLLQELQLVLSDYKRQRTRYSVTGAAEPRLEPNDIMTFVLPGGNKTLVCEQVTYNMALDNNGAILDMEVDGYES